MAQQIKKKFIQNDAVDGQKIKLQKDQSIRGQKQDGSEVELLKLDGSDKLVSGGQELAFKQVVDAQVSDLQGKLDSEQASRISGDSAEQSRAQGEESRIESKFDSMIASEESSRGNADQGLQSQINTEKGRIDAILSASDADKDSFAEIVELINSVDTESDSAFASYVLSNNTALASEVSSRQQGDQGLQSNIDAEETRAIGEESRIESKFDGAMSTEQAARIAGDSAEQTRAMGVESSLQSQVTQEISDRQSANSTEQTARIAGDADLQSQHDDLDGYAQDVRSDLDNLDGYAQDVRSDLDQEIVDRAAAVSAEASARQSADSSLQSSLSSEISRAQSAESTEQAARIAGDSSTLQSSKDYTDGKISLLMSNLDTEALDSLVEVVTAFQNADSNLNSTISSLSSSASSGLATEQAARIAADQTLQFDLDAAESAISSEVMRATGVEGGIDSRLVTAENEINTLQFDLDTAESAISSEVMRATGAEGGLDSRLVTAENEINTLQFDLDAAEAAISSEVMRATGVEGGLDSRIHALEVQNDGPYFQKQKFVIDEISELSSIELSHECMENSLVVCVGRLMVHKDEDYSVSVVSGKSVLTWMGDFATSGVEGIEAGDVIFVTFAREV